MRHIGLFTMFALIVVICAACQASISPGARSADKHAAAAGVAIENVSVLAMPTSTAVQSVVGTGSDDTIEALQADGTLYNGTIVLRITVAGGATIGDPTVIRCYRYTYRHLSGDSTPHKITCPSVATPVILPSLHPENLDDPAVMARLQSLLSALTPAQRGDADTITTIVEQSFGPPALVGVSVDTSGFSVMIDEGQQCLSARGASTGSPTEHYAHGVDCRGG